jgi:hypothetical protein
VRRLVLGILRELLERLRRFVELFLFGQDRPDEERSLHVRRRVREHGTVLGERIVVHTKSRIESAEEQTRVFVLRIDLESGLALLDRFRDETLLHVLGRQTQAHAR